MPLRLRVWCWSAAGLLTICGVLAGCNASSNSTEPAADRGTSVPSSPVPSAPRESTPAAESSPAEEATAAGERTAPAPAKPAPATTAVVDVMPTETAPPTAMPQVVLSAELAATSRVQVGAKLPAGDLKDLDGASKALADHLGEQLTVVVFWRAGGIYDTAELADLADLVVAPFKSQGVEVVAINVGDPADVVRNSVQEAGADFAQLLDADGNYFAEVATGKLPRTYLVDRDGNVLWFDIGYGRTTRRQLVDAIRYKLAN